MYHIQTHVGVGSGTAATQPVTAQLSYKTWQVWVNALGVEQERYHTTSPAHEAVVSFSITDGNGAFPGGGSTASATTGFDGRAQAAFTAGMVASAGRCQA